MDLGNEIEKEKKKFKTKAVMTPVAHARMTRTRSCKLLNLIKKANDLLKFQQ